MPGDGKQRRPLARCYLLSSKSRLHPIGVVADPNRSDLPRLRPLLTQRLTVPSVALLPPGVTYMRTKTFLLRPTRITMLEPKNRPDQDAAIGSMLPLLVTEGSGTIKRHDDIRPATIRGHHHCSTLSTHAQEAGGTKSEPEGAAGAAATRDVAHEVE
jgi:hypothetical protein